MYNLFITAQIGAWDRPHYVFDRSRFLEYTNEKIADTYKNLTEKRIDKLKSLPCIFAYEGLGETIRIGHLVSIKEIGKTIHIEYELHANIPEISYTVIKSITSLLDIRNWETNRTHWAVKDVNLIKILTSVDIIDPYFIKPRVEKVYSTIREYRNRAIAIKEPSRKITKIKGFIEKVLTEDNKLGRAVYYRGHSDKKKYKLEPSLFRKDEDGNYLYLENEHILYRELIVSNSADFSTDEYTIDSLVRMQHYSLPTRLLDITSNPLIALYFACKSNVDEEGEVIIFSMPKEQVKYFDSDTASILANLAKLSKNDKDAIDFNIKKFNGQLPIKRLTAFIKAEKPFFEPKISSADLHKIICVKGKKSNDRISSQAGAFLLFGIDSILNENGTPEIEVIRITVSNKASILKELDILDINESTVFPYIENSAKYVAEKYKFKKVVIK